MERNNWSFKDRERTLVKLKALFFKTLFHWVAASDFSISSFHVFLDLFSTSNLEFLLYIFCVLGLRLCDF
jgi:hypothetical protein